MYQFLATILKANMPWVKFLGASLFKLVYNGSKLIYSSLDFSNFSGPLGCLNDAIRASSQLFLHKIVFGNGCSVGHHISLNGQCVFEMGVGGWGTCKRVLSLHLKLVIRFRSSYFLTHSCLKSRENKKY